MVQYYLLISFVFLFSCAENDEQNIETDLSKLKELINVPDNPQRVQWLLIQKGNNRNLGPNDYHLLAVLEFEQNQYKKLKENFSNSTDISEKIFLNKNLFQDWYPPSIQSKFMDRGTHYELNTKVYDASIFLKGSFEEGYCFFSEDGKLFLFLYTK